MLKMFSHYNLVLIIYGHENDLSLYNYLCFTPFLALNSLHVGKQFIINR